MFLQAELRESVWLIEQLFTGINPSQSNLLGVCIFYSVDYLQKINDCIFLQIQAFDFHLLMIAVIPRPPPPSPVYSISWKFLFPPLNIKKIDQQIFQRSTTGRTLEIVEKIRLSRKLEKKLCSIVLQTCKDFNYRFSTALNDV